MQEGSVRKNVARITIAAIVLLGIVLFYFFFVTNGNDSEPAGTTTATSTSEILGSWTVERSSVDPSADEVRADGFNQSFTGYRLSIAEDLTVAVGRTTEISGDLQVSTGAADLQIEIDASTLNSGNAEIDELLANALEVTNNSTITYTLIEPIFIDPGTRTLEGSTLGELTLAGQTQEAEISYQAQLLTDTGVLADFTDADKLIQVAVSAEIDFDDFGIDSQSLDLDSGDVMLEGLLNFVPVAE